MIITIRNQFKQSTFRYIAIFIVIVMGVGMVSIPSLLRHEGGAAGDTDEVAEEVSLGEPGA